MHYYENANIQAAQGLNQDVNGRQEDGESGSYYKQEENDDGSYYEEEKKKICSEVAQKLGATSIKDMGKVMGELKKNYSDTLDFSKAGSLLKEILVK